MKRSFLKLKGIYLFSILLIFFLSCSKQRIADNTNAMVIQKKFDIAAGNNQGVAYNEGRVFVGYDFGKGRNDKIYVYNYQTGAKLKEVNGLSMGHSADMKYNTRDHLLYVVNGGALPTEVYTVNIEAPSPSVQRNYNLKILGTGGLISLDEANNRLFIISSESNGGAGNHTITPVDIATGVPDLAHQFSISYADLPFVPQGAAYNNGNIYFLLGTNSTVLAVIDVNTKSLVTKMITPSTPEPEGLDLVTTTKELKFVIGYRAKGVFDLISPQN